MAFSSEIYKRQYSKNYQLLLVEYQNQIKSKLDYECLASIHSSLNSSENPHFFKTKKYKNDVLYLLLSLLAIHEVDINLSHFNFVIFFTINKAKVLLETSRLE